MNKDDGTVYGVELSEFDEFFNSMGINGTEETKSLFREWLIKSLNTAWDNGYNSGMEAADSIY